MDPVTGTFTTMDTYGGSLSDPMSLHKYLFANSNPVMYSDPSGHFSLAEMDLSMAIDRILDSALMSGIYYCIDANATDPEHEHHDIFGYFRAILLGFIIGVVVVVIAETVLGLIILSVLGCICALTGSIKGLIDIFVNGYIGYGLFELVLSIIVFSVSWRNISNVWEAANATYAGNPDYHFDDSFDDVGIRDKAKNYNLTEEQYETHIIDRHGPNSTYVKKDKFNADFDIRKGIDNALTNVSSVYRHNTRGRSGYIFEYSYSTPIGSSPDGTNLYTIRVVMNDSGEVITAFPVKYEVHNGIYI